MTALRPPHEDDDFRQLTGAFDRPIAPSPRFAKSLKARLEREMPAPATINTSLTPPVSQRTARVSSAKPMARRRWVDVAIAAALIVAMLGGSFWYADTSISDDEPGVPEATRYAAQPLASEPALREPSTTSTTDTVARGGSSGSPERSLANPGLDPIEGPLSYAWSRTISDPIWVLPYGDVVATLGSSEIAVHEAATGEVLWSKSTTEAFRNTTYDTDTDAQLLLGTRQGTGIALPWIVGGTMYYTGTSDLIGVDLYTGEEVFRTVHTDPDTFDVDVFPRDMVVKDTAAYVLSMSPQGHFIIKAIDLTSGDVAWTFDGVELSAGPEDQPIWLWQPVVTDDFVIVILQAWEREDSSLLALNIEDGSVAWEQEEALFKGRSDNSLSMIGALGDDYLVMTTREIPTGFVNGTPNADESLGVSLYDLHTGEHLWTARQGAGEWKTADTCSLGVASTQTDVYISCTADEGFVLIGLGIENGQVTHSETYETETPVFLGFQDGDENLYFGGEDTLLRQDPDTFGLETIQIEDGDTCTPGSASSEVVICYTDDGLGTYGIQVYTRDSITATPTTDP